MDYNLQIKLSAINAATPQINAATASVDKLSNATKKASANSGNFAKSLESTGSRINVMGQRLTWMVSVPLLMFANKAIDTAVSIETAWVRFNKVFSGTEEQMKSLQKAGAELSTKFGVNVEDVAMVMGEFSKAGIDSEDSLKKLTEQALQTSILFDTDLTSAFEGVKAVMFGFNLNAEDTRNALAAINMVADKTTTSEQDILDVMQRAGGVFKQHNISVTEAASLTSLLAQSNIKGAIAGNSLKSIITGLDVVTNGANDSMAAFGIEMRGSTFRTATFTDKLKMFNDKQKEVFSSGNKMKIADWNEALGKVAGKLQISRFNMLIEKVGDMEGVMKQAGDETQNLKYWNEQLSTVLESSPQKLEIMNQMYRNQQAIIGNELLPIKMKLLEILISILEKFNSLSPETQKWITIIGGMAIIMGPALMAIGLMTAGLGFLSSGFMAVSGLVIKLTAQLPLMTNVMGIATGATTALSTALSVGLVLAFAAVAAVLVTKAIGSVNSMWQAMKDLKTVTDQNKTANQQLQDRINSMDAGPMREQLQKIHDDNAQGIKDAETLTERYKGLLGVWNSLSDWWSDKMNQKLMKWSESDQAKAREKDNNGGVAGRNTYFNNGGLVYAANGFLSKGRDTVPAMLSPGEMVLNKSQQSTMFDLLSGKSQAQNNGGISVNINVGTMLATPGEQRAFVRSIKQYLEEDNGRQRI